MLANNITDITTLNNELCKITAKTDTVTIRRVKEAYATLIQRHNKTSKDTDFWEEILNADLLSNLLQTTGFEVEAKDLLSKILNAVPNAGARQWVEAQLSSTGYNIFNWLLKENLGFLTTLLDTKYLDGLSPAAKTEFLISCLNSITWLSGKEPLSEPVINFLGRLLKTLGDIARESTVALEILKDLEGEDCLKIIIMNVQGTTMREPGLTDDTPPPTRQAEDPAIQWGALAKALGSAVSLLARWAWAYLSFNEPDKDHCLNEWALIKDRVNRAWGSAPAANPDLNTARTMPLAKYLALAPAPAPATSVKDQAKAAAVSSEPLHRHTPPRKLGGGGSDNEC